MITYKNRDAKLDDVGFAPYAVGDRVAQLIIVPYPHINFVEVDELSKTERGTGGHGSTGV